jgi:hypothetical protein
MNIVVLIIAPLLSDVNNPVFAEPEALRHARGTPRSTHDEFR